MHNRAHTNTHGHAHTHILVIMGSNRTSLSTLSFDSTPTQSNQNYDVEKNLRGVHDMMRLPSTPYPNTSKYGGVVESHVRGVVVPGDLIDDGCSHSTVHVPGPFNAFAKTKVTNDNGGSTYTLLDGPLEIKGPQLGGFRVCLDPHHRVPTPAQTGLGYCSGNVSSCAAECDAMPACKAFMFACHSPSTCATVNTINASSPTSFRCVFRASATLGQVPNFTVADCPTQWHNYTHIFGIDPTQDSPAPTLNLPVFEGIGNHDGGPMGGIPANDTFPSPPSPPAFDSTLIWRSVIARNRRRVAAASRIGAGGYTIANNGLHYAWSWGKVRFVMCNLYPGDEGGNAVANGTRSRVSPIHSPSYSLRFLKQELAKLGGEDPVVIFFHYPRESKRCLVANVFAADTNVSL